MALEETVFRSKGPIFCFGREIVLFDGLLCLVDDGEEMVAKCGFREAEYPEYQGHWTRSETPREG